MFSQTLSGGFPNLACHNACSASTNFPHSVFVTPVISRSVELSIFRRAARICLRVERPSCFSKYSSQLSGKRIYGHDVLPTSFTAKSFSLNSSGKYHTVNQSHRSSRVYPTMDSLESIPQMLVLPRFHTPAYIEALNNLRVLSLPFGEPERALSLFFSPHASSTGESQGTTRHLDFWQRVSTIARVYNQSMHGPMSTTRKIVP